MGLFDPPTPQERIRALGRARAARLRARRKAAASGADAIETNVTRATAQHDTAVMGRGEGNGAGNGNGKRNGNAATRDLRPREVRVVQGLLQGKTQSQALVDAGFNRSSNTVMDTVRPALTEALNAERITTARLAQNISNRMDAVSPTPFMVMGEDGKERSIERPDWTAQASGARDAIALLDRAGLLPAATPSVTGAQSITINYSPVYLAPQDVVDAEQPAIAQDAEASESE